MHFLPRSSSGGGGGKKGGGAADTYLVTSADGKLQLVGKRSSIIGLSEKLRCCVLLWNVMKARFLTKIWRVCFVK